jgi:hypothetical protein
VPNVIQSLIEPSTSNLEEDTTAGSSTVDLVYVDFIEPYISLAAKFAGLHVELPRDSDVYMSGTSMTELILGWIKENWQCDESAFQ